MLQIRHGFNSALRSTSKASVRLLASPPPVTAQKPLEGVCFVLTGEFDAIGNRDHITARLEARGAVSKSGVSKIVTHLIVGAAPGKSKLTKAEQLGIQQVGVDWLTEALAG